MSKSITIKGSVLSGAVPCGCCESERAVWNLRAPHLSMQVCVACLSVGIMIAAGYGEKVEVEGVSGG